LGERGAHCKVKGLSAAVSWAKTADSIALLDRFF